MRYGMWGLGCGVWGAGCGVSVWGGYGVWHWGFVFLALVLGFGFEDLRSGG